MKHLPLFLVSLTALLPLTACDRKSTQSLSSLFSGESDNWNVLPEKLNSENFWNYFSGTWNDPSYAGYIKFSIILNDDGSFQSLHWHPMNFVYHADYLKTLPEFSGLSSADIDRMSLREEGRRIILGTALSIKDLKASNAEWDIQIVSEDPLKPALVQRVMQLMAVENPNAETGKLFYLPAPQQLTYTLAQASAFEALGIKIASRQTLDDRVCYAAGWGAGYIKMLNTVELEKALAEGSIQSDDILVLESIPRELPEVAGIVIAASSSPSSHPALLAQMLGIPFFYEKEAMKSPLWHKYAESREPVFISARSPFGQGCEVLVRDSSALKAEDIASLRALKKPQPLALKDFDRTLPADVMALDQVLVQDGNKVGAKAANVAELRRIIPDHTITEGAALPISAFALFIAEGRDAKGQALKPQYDALLADLSRPGLRLSETLPLLAKLRTLIEKAQIPEDLRQRIINGVEGRFPKGSRVKLRSSSNMEDLPEFNGAGLYESKGACVGDDGLSANTQGLCGVERDEVAKALKKVWASLYSMKAWVARRTFSINEAHVGMGVLIQPSFKGELANGVAIAQYPQGAYFGEDGVLPDIEVVSTGFPGEDDSVTNPPVGKIPETIRLQKGMSEVLVASSEVPRGQKLLKEDENASLYSLIETIYRHYEALKKPTDKRSFVLDLEWKLIEVKGQKKIVIKQVRPVPAPSQSTQGLGFGNMIVGEKSALLCPSIQENADALTRLKLSMPIRVSVGLHEVPANDSTEIASPLASLEIRGNRIPAPNRSTLASEAWSEEWGSSFESRYTQVQSQFDYLGQSYTLAWKIKQSRSIAEKGHLAEGAQSLWTLDFSLSQGENSVPYILVLGQDTCNADAYQGIAPGSYNSTLSYTQNRKPPVAFEELYSAVDASGLSFNIKSKTSFQGFDKTRFHGIEEVLIKGILDRPIVLRQGAAAYAPGHHNFQWAFAFDTDLEAGLTQEEKAKLRARGIRYLLIDNPGEFFSEPIEFPENPEVLPEAEPLSLDNKGLLSEFVSEVEEVPLEKTFKVYGVLEDGTRTELGTVRLEQGTNPFLLHGMSN